MECCLDNKRLDPWVSCLQIRNHDGVGTDAYSLVDGVLKRCDTDLRLLQELSRDGSIVRRQQNCSSEAHDAVGEPLPRSVKSDALPMGVNMADHWCMLWPGHSPLDYHGYQETHVITHTSPWRCTYR